MYFPQSMFVFCVFSAADNEEVAKVVTTVCDSLISPHKNKCMVYSMQLPPHECIYVNTYVSL